MAGPIQSAGCTVEVSLEFVFPLYDLFFRFEVHDEHFVPISYVELTIWYIKECHVSFPFWNPSALQWDLKRYGALLLRPTLASVVQIVRFVFTKGCQILGLDQYHPGGHFLYRMVEPGYPAKPFF